MYSFWVSWPKVKKALSIYIFRLFITHNPIKMVDRECQQHILGCLKTEKVMQNVRFLGLSNSILKTWEAIENLESVCKLEELRCINIPLLDEYTEDERRHLYAWRSINPNSIWNRIVARLPNLKSLNGSEISPFQREESERFFIRYYKCDEKRPLIYDELVAKHGVLEPLAKVLHFIHIYKGSVKIGSES